MKHLAVFSFGAVAGFILVTLGSWAFAAVFFSGVLAALVIVQAYCIWGKGEIPQRLLLLARCPNKEAITQGTYYVVLEPGADGGDDKLVLLNREKGHSLAFELPPGATFRKNSYAVACEKGHRLRTVRGQRKKHEDETRRWGA